MGALDRVRSLDKVPPHAMAEMLALASAIEREEMELSFDLFVRNAWHVMEPSTGLVWNWHMGTLCGYLQALYEGRLRAPRLIINIPPGTSKPVHIDEPVLTNAGVKPLRDIRVGDRVLTHLARYRSVTAVHEQGVLPTCRVETFSGRRVRAAPDHPFLTARGWVAADDLAAGDYLGVPHFHGGDMSFDRVVCLSDAEDGECRCLTVDEDASFTANGVAVHNSLVASVFWPAWIWSKAPDRRFLVSSNDKTLVTRDNLKMRSLILSEWFQSYWGDVVKPDKTQWDKEFFQTLKLGFRQGVTMKGAVTGKRGDCLPAETVITTDRGPMTIREIHCAHDKPRVAAVDRGTVTWRTIVATREIDADELVELQTDGGRTVRATPGHLFRTERLGYVEAGNLLVGERIVACGPSVRPLRIDLRERPWRVSQSGCTGSVASILRQGLPARRPQDARQGSADLFFVRSRDRQVGDEMQIVPPQRFARRVQDAITHRVRALRSNLPAEIVLYKILRQGVRGYRAFAAYVRQWQLEFQRGQELRTGVPQAASGSYGAGRVSVRSVWSAGDKRDGSAWRDDANEIQVGGAPHRPRQPEQCSGESCHPVCVVPCDLPQLEQDTIGSIRRVRQEGVKVYDIQVEQTHNFFADGLLVHNCQIVDDPHDAKKALNASEVQAGTEAWDQGMSTRVNNMETSLRLIIMQRLRTNDLTGHILAKKDQEWVNLVIPMTYTGRPGFDPIKDIGPDAAHLADPRTKVGELLDPVRFPKTALMALRTDLGEYGWSGQMQQDPVPLGGGIIKKKWWVKWEAMHNWNKYHRGQRRKPPLMKHVFWSWDTAFTEQDRKDNAYTAGTKWGLFFDDETEEDRLMLINAWHGRVAFGDLKKRIRMASKEDTDAHLIERKASGISVIQELRRDRRVKIRSYDPRGDGDKESRAMLTTAHFERGLIVYPDRPWSEQLIDWVAAFPSGAPPSADYTDTVSQAILYVVRRQWIRHPDDISPIEPEPEEDEDEAPPKRHGTYG